MTRHILGSALVVASALGGVTSLQGARSAEQTQSQLDHVAWVAAVLKRMQTITPGMTRLQLLTVFATEGGISTGLRRTYVSRDCPYFKVDVEFEAVGRPGRDTEGRVTLVEGHEDRIIRISKPYLQSSIID